jgi:hypothetical protein
MECEMCAENNKEGLGKAVAEVAEVQNIWQACTKDRTGAVALRAALESAVQLGRGDEVNRQAEIACI